MKYERAGEVYQEHKDLIYRDILARTQNRELAEELCDQVFLKYLENYDRIEKGNELGWMMRVKQNLLIDHYRSGARHPVVGGSGGRELTPDEASDPAGIMEKRDLLNRIYEQLREKNRDWYEAVYLTIHLGMPEENAAKQLDISIELIRTRIYRSRKFIKMMFREEWKGH